MTDLFPANTPSVTDLFAWALTWGISSLLKRYANKTKWAVVVRRFLPLIAVGIGVVLQATLHAVFGGETWGQAIVRGLYTGGAAVMSHNLYKATALGQVNPLALPAPPQIDAPSDSEGEEGADTPC